MREDLVLADSAGHTMIDVGTPHPPERERPATGEAADEDKNGQRGRRGAPVTVS